MSFKPPLVRHAGVCTDITGSSTIFSHYFRYQIVSYEHTDASTGRRRQLMYTCMQDCVATATCRYHIAGVTGQICMSLAIGAVPEIYHMPTAEPHLGSRMPCQPLYDSPPPQVCGSAFRQPLQIIKSTPRAARQCLKGAELKGEEWRQEVTSGTMEGFSRMRPKLG